MMDTIMSGFFSPNNYMPHGHCYFWDPQILWLHMFSDGLIALSYFTIPITLFYFVRKRKDLDFNWIFLMFAAFILFCGGTHIWDIITIYRPYYAVQGLVKLLTALTSFLTAIMLIRLIPKALTIPSPSMLRAANEELKQEVEIRRQRELELKERTQALERSNAELERFAYVASHDLKEPLRMVSNYSQLLELNFGEILGDEGREYVQYTVDGAKRMQMLINDLLEYAQVDQAPMELEEADMEALWEEACKLLGPEIEAREAIIEQDALPKVYCLPGQILEVLQNLLSNALKFSTQRPEIKFSARQEGQEWVFTLQDKGLGFSQEYAEKIFVIFQRLHDKSKFPGTGIGLAICKKVIDRHKGRIWAESEPGKGATFYFTLPPGE